MALLVYPGADRPQSLLALGLGLGLLAVLLEWPLLDSVTNDRYLPPVSQMAVRLVAKRQATFKSEE